MTLNSTFPGAKTHFDQKSSLSLLYKNLCVGQDRMEEQHATEQEGDTGYSFPLFPWDPCRPHSPWASDRVSTKIYESLVVNRLADPWR